MTTPTTDPTTTPTDPTTPVDPNLAPADPGTSAVVPAPAPAGDFGTSSFWTSPSSYITVGTMVFPLVAILLPHRDVTADMKLLTTAAPVLAFLALIIMRGLHKVTVVKANAQLALQRNQHLHELTLTSLADNHPLAAKLQTLQTQVETLTAAQPATTLATARRTTTVTKA